MRALVILLFLAACGEDGALTMELTIDDSCISTDPAANDLGFAGNANLAVIDENNDVIRNVCPPFDADPGRSLADLPALLLTEPLRNLAGDQVVSLELAIYRSTGLGVTRCERYVCPGGDADYLAASEPFAPKSAGGTVSVTLRCPAPCN